MLNWAWAQLSHLTDTQYEATTGTRIRTATDGHLMNSCLENLAPARLAAYNSRLSTEINRHPCTENTRKDVLLNLGSWSDNPRAEKIYWMNGMAGTGKTTIACSLAMSLESRGQLAASFFCTRTSAECQDAYRIVPTIVYQLARRHAPFQSALYQTLSNDPDINSLNISLQFERLLVNPLLAVKRNIPNNMVVVIDALDECRNTQVVAQVLDLVFQYAARLPLKFFVTGRPEATIRNKITSQNPGIRSIFYLHDIEKSLVQADIEVYLQKELSSMTPSPTPAQIRQLAENAGNLFIYAATAVRYIRPGQTGVDSNERIVAMLSVNTPSTKKLENIDKLYSMILSAALGDSNLELQERYRIRRVVWTIVCAQEPISFDTVAAFAGLANERQVIAALEPLRSVLHVSQNSNLVSTLHASFSDYIFDPARSKQFSCDKALHHQLLAQECFKTMRLQLRFNICNLKSSFIPDVEVANLKQHIIHSISPSLFYACRYWTNHLSLAAASERLCHMLEDFLSRQLLFWMEVLNLKQCMVLGVEQLLSIQEWLASAEAPPDLIQSASDAHRFAASFAASPASISTPHIYVSALPLGSNSSPLFNGYRRRMHGLMVVKGSAIDYRRGAALATWVSDSEILSLTFSPDGTRVAFGTRNGRICIRNARDGRVLVGPFEAHQARVTATEFSPDGTHIVSGSHDCTVRVWDERDGRLIAGPFKHTEWVLSVGFSPDGGRIVSGSRDCTVRVWSLHDKALVTAPFAGHTDWVTSVVFSPDGTHVVSGSDDRTVRIWRAYDGASVTDPLEGHAKAITSVAFSSNGTHIASGSDDRTICIWDVQRKALAASPLTGHTDGVRSVKFSPNGAHVVSGSSDRTVRVWSVQKGVLVAGPFQGHTDWVTSVQFSPNGTHIVSGSDDRTIRTWHVLDGLLATGPREGHSDAVTSVSFSPDNTRIVSGSIDRSIRVWHSRNGSLVSRPFQGHTSAIRSVTFSPDGTQIVSGSDDRTIRVWNAQDGKLVASPLTYHSNAVNSVKLSPDGRFTASGSDDRTVRVWDIHGGALADEFLWHMDKVTSVDFSPEGTRVVFCSSACIGLWRLHSPTTPTLNPNGTVAASRPQLQLGHNKSRVTSVGFSPDNARIASGSEDGKVCLWDMQNELRVSKTFEGHTKGVTSVAFSPDSAYFASGSRDCTIRVWRPHGGTPVIGPIEGHTDEVTSVAFSLDGTRIVSGSNDRTIRVWELGETGGAPAALAGPWVLRNDGWFVNSESQLLFCIPSDIAGFFPRLNNSFTICPQGTLQVDYNNMLLGRRWAECYADA